MEVAVFMQVCILPKVDAKNIKIDLIFFSSLALLFYSIYKDHSIKKDGCCLKSWQKDALFTVAPFQGNQCSFMS